MSNLQLSAIGYQDIYLIDNSKETLNFMEYKYEKYRNIAIIPNKINSRETINFGKKIIFTIPKDKGDFLNKMFLYLTLPKINQPTGFEEYIGYTNSIMNTLIKKVELDIGRVTIATSYGITSEIYDEYSLTNKDLLIGKSDTNLSLKFNALNEHTYYYPLNFWFNKDISNSLPLLLMRNSEITLSFYLRDLSECLVYNINDDLIQNYISQLNILSGGLIANYILVDNDYRNSFYNDNKLNTKSYLIEQELLITESIPQNKLNYSVSLILNNPIKALYFVFVETNSELNNDWFNFNRRSDNKPLMVEMNLQLDGIDKYNDLLPESYFRLVHSFEYFNNIPNKFIYCIPFSCKNPMDLNPSGTINGSRISEFKYRLIMNSDNNPECNMYIIAVNYNILKIRQGYSAIAFMD